MFVVDVGASGGIDSYWSEFRDQLRAVGIDPLVAEVKRLNARAPGCVRYQAAWVTCGGERVGRDADDAVLQRTSAVRAAQITGLDYAGSISMRARRSR